MLLSHQEVSIDYPWVDRSGQRHTDVLSGREAYTSTGRYLHVEQVNGRNRPTGPFLLSLGRDQTLTPVPRRGI